jgi:hypothetical protein
MFSETSVLSRATRYSATETSIIDSAVKAPHKTEFVDPTHSVHVPLLFRTKSYTRTNSLAELHCTFYVSRRGATRQKVLVSEPRGT